VAEVELKKVNETYYQIKCDRGIAYELNDYFSFYVPGYKFMPAYKNKLWDGKIRLFRLNNKTIYGGLINQVEFFCNSREYSFLNHDPAYNNEISMSDIISFTEEINGPYIPKDYQFKALAHTLRQQKLLLLSPTSSGKSYIIYQAIRYLMDEVGLEKGLLLVPNLNLIQQMYNDFHEYSIKNKWDLNGNIHMIFQGQKKENPNARLYLSTWQSIYNQPDKYFQQFDYLICDEVHQAKSKSITKIVSGATNASWKIGLTGTLDDSETNELVLRGLFGPVNQVTTTKKLMDRKDISNLTIKSIQLDYPKEARKIISKMNYHSYYEALIGFEKRNRFILNLAKSLPGNGLILFQFVDKHGKLLYNRMVDENPGMDIRFISGKVSKDDREAIRQEMIQGDNIKLFASYGTFSTGVNIPNLKWIISTTPGKSRVRILQSIGRALRKHADKTGAVFYDISDDTSWKTKEGFGISHLQSRLEMYMSEKFKIEHYKVEI